METAAYAEARQAGIAPCLSTVRNADRIFLIQEGRVVLSGRHEDLMIQDEYHKFFESQTA